MPSPFPGIDPYFEAEMGSGDFRHSFVVYLSERLNQILPQKYVARFHRRSFAVDPDAGPPFAEDDANWVEQHARAAATN